DPQYGYPTRSGVTAHRRACAPPPVPTVTRARTEERAGVSRGRRWTLELALALVVTTVLAAADATRRLDQSLLEVAQSVANETLDLIASLVSILGQAELTVAMTLALAMVWWRRE